MEKHFYPFKFVPLYSPAGQTGLYRAGKHLPLNSHGAFVQGFLKSPSLFHLISLHVFLMSAFENLQFGL